MTHLSGKTRACRRIGRFASEEDGGGLFFGIGSFVVLMMVCGFGVSMMKHELRRAELTQISDRAVLAAAALRQSLDPTEVATDVFKKAGRIDDLKSVDVDKMMNSKRVSVKASADVPTVTGLFGIHSMPVYAASTAKEKITDVEIALVLDISGSMNEGSPTKLTRLKPAARDFIDLIFKNAIPGKISLSIVPYATQVNVGATMASVLNMPLNDSRGYCADFSKADYSTTAISKDTLLRQSANADFGSAKSTMKPSKTEINLTCPQASTSTLMPVSGDVAALKAKITGLVANPYTSLDVGMKWGAALVDPAAKGIVSGLISKGAVSATYSGLPRDPKDFQVLKVIILMTDGQNTNEFQFEPAFKSGPSNIFMDDKTKKLASFHENGDPCGSYYMPDDKTYDCKGEKSNWAAKPFGKDSGWSKLDWADVWANGTLNYVASRLLDEPTKKSNFWAGKIAKNFAGDKNARTESICAAAKAKGVIVYTIGFAGTVGGKVGGEAVLKKCATAPGYYYSVDGLSISAAFKSIAGQLTQLKLTQ